MLDGAAVGAESMVGAGALVPPGMIVPSRVLVLGIPARVVRPLSAEDVASIRASAETYRKLRLTY